MWVILDTNVLISAFLWKGKAHILLSAIDTGEIIPCFSPETLEELRGVLRRAKFKDELAKANLTIETIVNRLFLKGEVFKLPKTEFKLIKEEPTDDKFLHLAKIAKVKYLVSGDKHLLELGKFGKTKILSIFQFLKIKSKPP